jgi:hypothetical protein
VLVSHADTVVATTSLSDDDVAFLATGTLVPSTRPRVELRHVRTTRMTVMDSVGRRETVATTRKTLPVHMSTAAGMTPRRLFFLECMGLEPLVPARASAGDDEHLRVLGAQSRL